MALVFLDSNALLKLYLPEIGATWLRNFVVGKQIVISELAMIESATVLRRKYLEGSYTRDEAADLYEQITVDSSNYDIIPLGSKQQLNKIVDLCFSLPVGLRLRALDAIQIAVAEIVREASVNLVPSASFTFVSADRQLVQVAQSLGLTVENPEDYP
jgi:hypothetical protein